MDRRFLIIWTLCSEAMPQKDIRILYEFTRDRSKLVFSCAPVTESFSEYFYYVYPHLDAINLLVSHSIVLEGTILLETLAR